MRNILAGNANISQLIHTLRIARLRDATKIQNYFKQVL